MTHLLTVVAAAMDEKLQGYLSLFLIWLVTMVLVRAIVAIFGTTSRFPPSPWSLPIIGHLHLLAPIPHQALHKLSNKFGPLMHIFLGSVPCVVASSPEIAREFLKTNEIAFSNRPTLAAVEYLTYGSTDFTFAPYGPYWKFMKKLCMSELLNGRMLDQLHPIRREEIKNFLSLMLKKANASEPVDVGGELITVVNNIVSRMMMSQRCSEIEDEVGGIRKVVEEAAELIGKLNLSDCIWFCKNLDLQGFGKRLKGVRDKFDRMMEKIIDEHENARLKGEMDGSGAESSKDILDILLDIAEDEKSEIKMTRENIKAFILDLFVAGTDTSTITIEWALAELINHPNVMHKARQEIESTVGQNRIVEESDLYNLPYLQSIVKETLRLHPPGPLLVRQSSERCTIASYDIPARTRLLVNVWAIGRDPKYWNNPLEFRPERFTAIEDGCGSSKLDVRGQHFHLLPFGSGRRGCPATSLGLQIVQTCLAAMIQCFEWKVSDGSVDANVVMEEGPGLTLPRAHPLICIPVARLKSFPANELQ